MFKKYQIIILGIILFSLQLCGACTKEPDWNLKLDTVKHILSIKVGSKQGLLDGKRFSTTAPILKDGTIYISAQLFSDAKIGQVRWYKKEKYVDIDVLNNKYKEIFSSIRYRLGSPYIYSAIHSGNEYKISDIPKPFEKEGIFYIPAVAFQKAFSKSIYATKDTLNINWDERIISTQGIPERTSLKDVNLTVIYNEKLYSPSIYPAIAIGPFQGGVMKNESKKDEKLDGKNYKVYTSTLALKPGKNIFLFMENGGISEKPFVIDSEVEPKQNVPIPYQDAPMFGELSSEIFEITNPQWGYIELNSPARLMFKGNLKIERIGDNVFTLNIKKLINSRLQNYKYIYATVVDGKIISNIDLPEKGYYVIEFESPRYIQSGGSTSGPGSTKWAELRVEVK